MSTVRLSDDVEIRRVVSLQQAAEICGISQDSLRRHHRDKIVLLSPRRVGMRLIDVLAIGQKPDKH